MRLGDWVPKRVETGVFWGFDTRYTQVQFTYNVPGRMPALFPFVGGIRCIRFRPWFTQRVYARHKRQRAESQTIWPITKVGSKKRKQKWRAPKLQSPVTGPEDKVPPQLGPQETSGSVHHARMASEGTSTLHTRSQRNGPSVYQDANQDGYAPRATGCARKKAKTRRVQKRYGASTADGLRPVTLSLFAKNGSKTVNSLPCTEQHPIWKP